MLPPVIGLVHLLLIAHHLLRFLGVAVFVCWAHPVADVVAWRQILATRAHLVVLV